MPKWEFTKNNDGEIIGIHNAGIENFTKSTYQSLAREICQNSLDATIEGKKVIVEFALSTFDKNDIEINKIEDKIKKMRDYWHEDNDALIFLDKALQSIKNIYCVVLRISDYNTTGLSGCTIKDNGTTKLVRTNWHALVKGKGVSNKKMSAGGSFGIGKNAALAVSKIRTILYSTLDIEGNKAYQGYSHLVSFSENNESYKGHGYYGESNAMQIIGENLSLDSNFKRDKSGTDIFILCPEFENLEKKGTVEGEEWKYNIMRAVISEFLLAIYNETLEVVIKDDVSELIINKTTIEKCFIDLLNIFPKKNKDIKHSKDIFYMLCNPKKQEKMVDFLDKGQIKITWIREKDLCSWQYFFRSNGMKITNTNKIAIGSDYIALTELVDEEINGYFKSLENPKHNSWESNNKKDKENIQHLFDLVFRTIEEDAIKNIGEAIDPEGAADILADIDSENSNLDKNKNDGIPDKITNIEITVNPTNSSGENDNSTDDTFEPVTIDGDGDGDGDLIPDTDDYKITDNHHDPNPFPKPKHPFVITGITLVYGDKEYKKSSKFNCRTFIVSENNNKLKYKLSFIPIKSYKDVQLRILRAGETGKGSKNYEVDILSAKLICGSSNIVLNENKLIELSDISLNKKVQLEFEIDNSVKCALEVELYEIQKK